MPLESNPYVLDQGLEYLIGKNGATPTGVCCGVGGLGAPFFECGGRSLTVGRKLWTETKSNFNKTTGTPLCWIQILAAW